MGDDAGLGTAALSGPTLTSMSYSFAFIGTAYGRHYTATVRAVDISSITSATTPSVSFSTAGSPGDVLPPTPSISVPAMDAVLPAGAITIQGSAGDNVGVAQVQLSIKDRTTNRWLNPATGTFDNGPQIWFASSLGTAGGVETTWSYDFGQAGAGSGSYYATARASDAAGNPSTTMPFTRFTVSGPPDTTAPDTVIAVPTSGQSFALGTVTMSGSASDNVGVSSVRVAIQDTGSGQWWTGSTWAASQQWLNATLFSPGAPSTGWSYAWHSPASGGYTAFARATDAATNVDTSPASRASTVLPVDTTLPDTTISSPVNGSSGPAPIGISGSATDNSGVAAVRVAIRNNATLQWWTGTGWGAGGSYVVATLDDPGGVAVNWSYPFDPGIAGNFGIQVKSVDTSGNVGGNTTWRNFNITAPGGDTTGPTIALTTPSSGQSLPFGSVGVSGTSSDPSGVAAVRVSIQDSNSLQWWIRDGLGYRHHVRYRDARRPGRHEYGLRIHVQPRGRGQLRGTGPRCRFDRQPRHEHRAAELHDPAAVRRHVGTCDPRQHAIEQLVGAGADHGERHRLRRGRRHGGSRLDQERCHRPVVERIGVGSLHLRDGRSGYARRRQHGLDIHLQPTGDRWLWLPGASVGCGREPGREHHLEGLHGYLSFHRMSTGGTGRAARGPPLPCPRPGAWVSGDSVRGS